MRTFQLALIVASLCLLLPQTSFAVNAYGEGSLMGGYNDNYKNEPEGSPDHDGSPFINPSAYFNFNWDVGRGDEIYFDLMGDVEIYVSPKTNTATFFRLGPGYRFNTAGNWRHEIAYHLTRASGFGDYQASPTRPAPGTRQGAPVETGTTDPFLNHEIDYEGLFGASRRVRVGPHVRYSLTDYQRTTQRDALFAPSGKLLIAVSPAVNLAFEMGIVFNDSNWDRASYTGPLFSTGLDWNIARDMDFRFGYRYLNRDFDISNRTDTNQILVFGFSRQLRTDLDLEIEFTHTSNDSNFNAADYSSNAISAGVSMNLF